MTTAAPPPPPSSPPPPRIPGERRSAPPDSGDGKLRLLEHNPVISLLSIPAYTRLVKFLKLALPLVSVALIAILFCWPYMADSPEPAPREFTEETVMKNELISPRFESRDKQNQPYSVTADRAVQSDRDPDLVLLENPKATLTLEKGDVGASALHGAYAQETEALRLEQNVVLTYDGYEFHASAVDVDLKGYSAFSDRPVEGAGPDASLSAAGLKADGNTDTLILTGPAKLVLKKPLKGLDEAP